MDEATKAKWAASANRMAMEAMAACGAVPKEDVYCTSFCNQGHRLSNGHPVNHECYVLKPEALALEKDGKVEEAVKTGVRTDRVLNPKKVQVL